jgi:citrate synthase
MSDSAYTSWDYQRGVIRTRIGGWKIGKGVTTYGYSLIDELVGNSSYFEVLILSITGKIPDPNLAKWTEAIYSCMSFPDPRIWCNQIGALAGSMRTPPISGITAGIQASDSRMYGPGTANDTYAFLSSAMKQHDEGINVQGIVEGMSRRPGSKPIIPGYGRPLATGDERVVAMNKVTKQLGFEWDPYMLLAREIDHYMLTNYGESMNLATFIVAFLRDQQWSLEQIRQLTSIIVTAGVAACYSEAYDKPAETFLPLRCEDIDYRGIGPRSVPEKD